MLNRLFKDSPKLTLFKKVAGMGEAVGEFLRDMKPNSLLLARQNIKLLRLVQKLINSILNPVINATIVETEKAGEGEKKPDDGATPSGGVQEAPTGQPAQEPEKEKEPDQSAGMAAAWGTTEASVRGLLLFKAAAEVVDKVPAKTSSTSSTPSDSQKRAVLIRTVQDLLKFCRQTTALVRGNITDTSESSSEVWEKFQVWLEKESKSIKEILKAGKMDESEVDRLFTRDRYPDGDDADRVIAALYLGLTEWKRDKPLQYLMVRMVRLGGEEFLRERRRDVIRLLHEFLAGIRQRGKLKSLDRTLAAINKALARLSVDTDRMIRYESMAEDAIRFSTVKFADGNTELELINVVVQTLLQPDFLTKRKAIIKSLHPDIRHKINTALGKFGLRPLEKIQDTEIKKIEFAYVHFNAAANVLLQEMAKISPDAVASMEALVSEINSGNVGQAQELVKVIDAVLVVVNGVGEALKEFVELKEEPANHVVKLFATLTTAVSGASENVKKAIADIRDLASQSAGSVTAATSLLLMSKVAADPVPAGDVGGEPGPEQATTPRQANPAEKISSELIDEFDRLWDEYVAATDRLELALPKAIVDQKEFEAGEAASSIKPQLPALSFKGDETISKILSDIKDWFTENEELMARVIKPTMIGTGTLGTKSQEDLRTIAAIAEDIKKRATGLIDQLLQ